MNELKLDRLLIDSSSSLLDKIILRHLNALTIGHTNDKYLLNIDFLDLSSMSNLLSLHLPQLLLPHYSQLPKLLETLILVECRHFDFDFVHQCQNLRRLKLYFNNFDRLMENNGELMMKLISSIYIKNKTMESVQLMCHAANRTKIKLFQEQFHLNKIDYLNVNYDGKSLIIHRSKDYFCQFV